MNTSLWLLSGRVLSSYKNSFKPSATTLRHSVSSSTTTYRKWVVMTSSSRWEASALSSLETLRRSTSSTASRSYTSLRLVSTRHSISSTRFLDMSVSSLQLDNNNNNKLIKSAKNDVYGSVIMTQLIARVYLVHLMNVGQRQAAAYSQTKRVIVGRELACRLLASTATITNWPSWYRATVCLSVCLHLHFVNLSVQQNVNEIHYISRSRTIHATWSCY